MAEIRPSIAFSRLDGLAYMMNDCMVLTWIKAYGVLRFDFKKHKNVYFRESMAWLKWFSVSL